MLLCMGIEPDTERLSQALDAGVLITHLPDGTEQHSKTENGAGGGRVGGDGDGDVESRGCSC